MLLVEPTLNAGLELAEPTAEDRLHSNSSFRRWRWRSGYFTKHRNPPGISSYFNSCRRRTRQTSLDRGLIGGAVRFASMPEQELPRVQNRPQHIFPRLALVRS